MTKLKISQSKKEHREKHLAHWVEKSKSIFTKVNKENLWVYQLEARWVSW